MTRMRRRPPASIATSDARRAGIERVLDELFHRGRWPLDHLASGDAIDKDGIETADRHVDPRSRATLQSHRPPGDRDEQRPIAKEPLRGALGIVHRYGFDQLVARVEIFDAIAFGLQVHEMRRDFGRGIEA